MAVVIDGTNGVSSPDYEVDGVTGQLYPVVSGTAKAWNWNGLTTNKEIDFTGIPSWVKKITVMLSGLSTNGTSVPILQLGDSGGVENTGYLGSASGIAAVSVASSNFTAGFGLSNSNTAATITHGSLTLSLVDSASNLWACSGATARSDVAYSNVTSGTKTLSDTLTQIRITTAGGTDNFDAGTINILYE